MRRLKTRLGSGILEVAIAGAPILLGVRSEASTALLAAVYV